MIKDLNEAEYRAVIVKSMKEADEEEKEYDKELLRALKEEYGEDGGRRYYDDYRYKTSGRFAPKGRGSYMPRRGYEEPPYYHMMPYEMSVGDYKEHSPEYWRDVDKVAGRLYFSEPLEHGEKVGEHKENLHESRYDRAKRMYTETKDMHKGNTPEDKQAKLKELETYMKSLAEDLTEIIEGATPEERAMAKNKLSVLVQKMA